MPKCHSCGHVRCTWHWTSPRAPLPPLQGGHLLQAAFPAPAPPFCSGPCPRWMVYSVAVRCLPRSSLAARGSMVVCHRAQLLGLGRDGARTPGLTPWETLWGGEWRGRQRSGSTVQRHRVPACGRPAQVRWGGQGLAWRHRAGQAGTGLGRVMESTPATQSCSPVRLQGTVVSPTATCTPCSEPQQGRHWSWPLPAPCHPQQRHSRFCFPEPDPCLPSVTCLPCHLSSLRHHLSS